MPTTASPANVLPFTPAASVPAAPKSVPKKDDNAPSFAKALADQKGATRQDAPARKADAKPASDAKSKESKSADSQQDASPIASADGKPPADAPNQANPANPETGPADPADMSAALLAQAQAQAVAQVQTAPVPALPLQALEIAAQSAALQSQSAAKLAALQPDSQANMAAQAAVPARGAQPDAARPTAAQAAAAALQVTALPEQVAQTALPAANPASAQGNANPLATLRQAIATARDPRAMAHADAASQRAQATQDAVVQAATTTDTPPALLPEVGAQTAQPRDDGSNARTDLAAFSAAGLRAVPAQAAPAADTRAAPPAPILEVPSPVGSANWGRDLGRQLVLLGGDAQRGQHTAELRLDPPDLGPLRVTLSLSDGVATASFVSAHASVRQALESALPQLQQALADAGISLGQADVGDQNQFAQEQSQANRQGNGQAAAGAESQGEADAAQRVAVVRDSNALVDTFA